MGRRPRCQPAWPRRADSEAKPRRDILSNATKGSEPGHFSLADRLSFGRYRGRLFSIRVGTGAAYGTSSWPRGTIRAVQNERVPASFLRNNGASPFITVFPFCWNPLGLRRLAFSPSFRPPRCVDIAKQFACIPFSIRTSFWGNAARTISFSSFAADVVS